MGDIIYEDLSEALYRARCLCAYCQVKYCERRRR